MEQLPKVREHEVPGQHRQVALACHEVIEGPLHDRLMRTRLMACEYDLLGQRSLLTALPPQKQCSTKLQQSVSFADINPDLLKGVLHLENAGPSAR